MANADRSDTGTAFTESDKHHREKQWQFTCQEPYTRAGPAQVGLTQSRLPRELVRRCAGEAYRPVRSTLYEEPRDTLQPIQ
eukprot:1048379-Pyramimonas_sp.AAC.2